MLGLSMTGLYIHQDVKFGVSILSLFMDYLFYFLISLFLLLCVSVWVLGFVGFVFHFGNFEAQHILCWFQNLSCVSLVYIVCSKNAFIWLWDILFIHMLMMLICCDLNVCSRCPFLFNFPPQLIMYNLTQSLCEKRLFHLH